MHKTSIIPGKKIGRTLGFPTINLKETVFLKKIKKGVYAVKVNLSGDSYLGLFYKGPRLIIGDLETSYEIYILDFTKKTHGRDLSFNILFKIRDVISFSGSDDYKLQLKKDIEKARDLAGTLK